VEKMSVIPRKLEVKQNHFFVFDSGKNDSLAVFIHYGDVLNAFRAFIEHHEKVNLKITIEPAIFKMRRSLRSRQCVKEDWQIESVPWKTIARDLCRKSLQTKEVKEKNNEQDFYIDEETDKERQKEFLAKVRKKEGILDET
jgi:hypothetical protein